MQVPRCAVGTYGYERAAGGQCERYKLHLKAKLFNLLHSLSAASVLICVDGRHVGCLLLRLLWGCLDTTVLRTV